MTQLNTSGTLCCILLGICSLASSPSLFAHCAGNHTDNHPHCTGGGTSGGDQDPVFTAVGLSYDPITLALTGYLFTEVDSHSLDPGDVIVYRNVTMDLTLFDSLTGCSHGSATGTLSTRPKSSEDPDIAVVRFGFRSLLNNEQEAHHVLIMEGYFEDQYNWPPATSPAVLKDFISWELAAEKKKDQRSDCAGDSTEHGIGGVWEVTVARQSD